MAAPPTNTADLERLLTPKEATQVLRLGLSWLAKARMRGDGPPYVKLRRTVRYRHDPVAESACATLNERGLAIGAELSERLSSLRVEQEHNNPSQYITIHHQKYNRTEIRKK